MFETEKDALDWYESKPRALSKEFLSSIPWEKVSDYPLNKQFIPVLLYMRDVETFTEIYYQELLRTPTGKDPVISKFMARWSEEEQLHGELLNRFLNEAGFETRKEWQSESKSAIPLRYTFENYVTSMVTNLFGKRFSGAHMAWGAINEMMTLQGYRRLWQLAEHPVLEYILRGIAREESAHAKFYWSIARLKLERSVPAQKLARFVISKFWSPVGQGTKPQAETDYLIATLFEGADGISFFDRNVNQRIERLPGFAGLKTVRERVAGIALKEAVYS